CEGIRSGTARTGGSGLARPRSGWFGCEGVRYRQFQLAVGSGLEGDAAVRSPPEQGIDVRVVDARLDQGTHELALTLLVEVVEGSLLAVFTLCNHPEEERVATSRHRSECDVSLGAQVENQPV